MSDDGARQPPRLVRERVACPLCGARDSQPERIVEDYELERCRSCDLVFVNPQPTEESLTHLYLQKTPESQAEFYRQTVSAAQIAEYDRILTDLKDLYRLRPSAGSRLRGRLLHAARSTRGFRGTRHRPRHLGGRHRGGTWRSQREMRAAGGRGVCRRVVDVVHSSQVFEHLPDQPTELKEIRRVLRPGGILYINVPNYRCLSIVLGRDDFELNTPPEHVAYYTPRTLAALLSRAGFDVVRTASYGGLKWENLLGRPIRSEIAEAVRKGSDSSSIQHHGLEGTPGRPGVLGRLARAILYRRMQVGMSLEAFARRL